MSYQQQQFQPAATSTPDGQQQQQPQQPGSGNETPANDSPAPGFPQQQGTGGSQHGSDNMGEKTTLWYEILGARA